MVISNINHTKRCDSRCESFNGYKTTCIYRTPMLESRSDYNWRLYKMRDDKQHEKTTYKENGEVKMELIQGSYPNVSYGRCNKDQIVTRSERVKSRKRVSAGGVL